MDLQYLHSGLNCWVRELDFTVNTAWTEQGGVKDIDSVGRHDDFDGLCGLKSVKLIE